MHFGRHVGIWQRDDELLGEHWRNWRDEGTLAKHSINVQANSSEKIAGWKQTRHLGRSFRYDLLRSTIKVRSAFYHYTGTDYRRHLLRYVQHDLSCWTVKFTVC